MPYPTFSNTGRGAEVAPTGGTDGGGALDIAPESLRPNHHLSSHSLFTAYVCSVRSSKPRTRIAWAREKNNTQAAGVRVHSWGPERFPNRNFAVDPMTEGDRFSSRAPAYIGRSVGGKQSSRETATS